MPASPRIELLQGTLDLLIMRSLLFRDLHGHAIAHAIEQLSEDVLQVGHGSLYPALQRLLARGWISAADGISENNRKARFYHLTPKGRKQFQSEASKWSRLSNAVTRVLSPLPQQGE